MTLTTLAIFIAYVVLMLLSLVLDPKRGKSRPGAKKSMLHLLLFSTFKMLFAIGIVIVVSLVSGVDLSRVLGFSGSSLSWQDIGLGIIAAIGFVVIYLLWQVIISHISARGQLDEAKSGVVDLLPKQWVPLVGIFFVISLEAGLLEEIFFRGIMQSHMDIFFTAVWAALASGVLFGIAHVYQGLLGVVGTSALGIWLGLTYAVTDNLLVPILGHFCGDFLCMILGARHIIRPQGHK